MKFKYLLLFFLYFSAGHTHAQTTDFNKGMTAFKAHDYKTTVVQLIGFAKKGSCIAQYMVGYSYAYDQDIKNDSLAIHWLLLAAEQKQVKAMAALADRYFWNDKLTDHLAKSYLWGMLGSTYDPAQQINTITLMAKAYMKPDELDRANKLIDEYERRWFGKQNCE